MLETTYKELAHISTQSQNELALLEEQLEEKENEIMSTTNKLSMLENDKLSLQQKIRWLKSGIARKKATHLFSSPPKPVVRKSVETEDKFVQTQSTSSSKGVTTDIKNIQMNDIVIFDGKEDTDNKDAIFQGCGYFGNKGEHRKLTSGWENIYFEVSSKTKTCYEIGKRDLQKQDKILSKCSCYLAGSLSNEERALHLSEFMKANKDLCKDALQQAGFKLLDTLTVQQTITLQSLLRMPTNKRRNLWIFLSKFNVNILPSKRKVREERTPMVSHVKEEAVESRFIGLKKTKNEKVVTQCAYLRMKDIKCFIEEIIKRDTSRFKDSNEFSGKWWLLFSGDKGSYFM